MSGSPGPGPNPSKSNRSPLLAWIERNATVITILLTAVGVTSGIVFGIVQSGVLKTPEASSATASSAVTSLTTAVPGPAATEQLLFRPFTDGGLASDFTVANADSGECIVAAMTSSDPEALRCFTDQASLVLDPCWSNVTRDEAACLEDPWKKIVVLVTPANIEEADIELPTLDPTARPFAIEIVTPEGERLGCTALSSFAGSVAGLQRLHECQALDGSGASGALFGDIDRGAGQWRVRYASSGGSELRWVPIVRAWS